MGIHYDHRCKTKPYQAYYHDMELKRRVSIGMFATRREAQAAIDAESIRLGRPLEMKKVRAELTKFNNWQQIENNYRRKEEKEREKIPVKNGVIQFGVIVLKENNHERS